MSEDGGETGKVVTKRKQEVGRGVVEWEGMEYRE